MKKSIYIIGLFILFALYAFLGNVSIVNAGKYNSFLQGGMWDSANGCEGAGCVSYSPPPVAVSLFQATTAVPAPVCNAANTACVLKFTNTVGVGQTGYTTASYNNGALIGSSIQISGFYQGGSGGWYPIGTVTNNNNDNNNNNNAGPAPTSVPYGILQGRAVNLDTIPQTCDEIKASTNYLAGTVLTPKTGTTNLQAQTQASGSAYLVWAAVLGTYTMVPTDNGTQSIRVCRTVGGTVSTFGSYTGVLANGSTLTFDVSYSPLGPWFQAQGGDVYAANRLSSLIPIGALPRTFMFDGDAPGEHPKNRTPGLVTYGGASAASYDFDASTQSYGETLVSSENWLVNHENATQDLYAFFYSKFGAPQVADYSSPSAAIDQPASRATPYYVTGDMSTSGDWTVPDGQKVILLVDGDVTINGQMHTTGTGMLIVIARGDILFAPSVGVVNTSSTASIEGVYIAGDTLHTGISSTAGAERFVGKGIFIGNSVSLERNLESLSLNPTRSASLFIYNPAYLVNLPDEMKDSAITWQEVAP